MNMLDWFTKGRRTNEAIAEAIRENNARLADIAKGLNDRESLERIREEIQAGLQNKALEKALGSTCERVDVLNLTLRDSSVRPIPVQTFPLQDDFRFEEQKQKLGYAAARRFVEVGDSFAGKLADAHKPVSQAMEKPALLASVA